MSNLKTLFHDASLKNGNFVLGLDAVSAYPHQRQTLEKYAKADIAWLKRAYKLTPLPWKTKPKKVKHNAAFRTVSDKKWAGHKNNKPKHFWGKKRRRQGGWKA